MEIVSAEHPEAKFLIQSSSIENAENIRQAMDKMKRSPNRVEFIEIPLDTDRYHDLIRSADCILVPYDPEKYQGRSSGVFAEAVALGKPVVSTRNTWMAENVLKYQCGILMEDFNSAGLAKAMKDYIDTKKEFDEKAEAAAAAWRENHGAKRYVDIVLSLIGSAPRPAT
jgi:glycosyltransferase involved in cell wall biosynthesis